MNRNTKVVKRVCNYCDISYQMDKENGFIAYDVKAKGSDIPMMQAVMPEEGTITFVTSLVMDTSGIDRGRLVEVINDINAHMVVGAFIFDRKTGLLGFKSGIMTTDKNLEAEIMAHMEVGIRAMSMHIADFENLIVTEHVAEKNIDQMYR